MNSIRDQRLSLSICIPTYNRVKSLENLMNILLPQCAGSSVQIVVSNNCSSDDTDSFCRVLESRESCFDYVCQKSNIGFSGNLRAAMELSRGDFIWMLGDDDIPSPGIVNKILNLLDKDVGWIAGNFKKVDNESGREKVVFNFPDSNSGYDLEQCLNNLGIWASFMSISIVSSNVKKYFDSVPNNDFFGFSVALAAGMQGGWFLYDEVIVSRKVTPFREHRFDNADTYIFDFFSYIDYLVLEKKLSKRIRNKLANQMSFTISRLCLQCKINNKPLPRWSLIYAKHSKVRNFWLFVQPIYILPAHLLRFFLRLVQHVASVFNIKKLKDL